MKEKLKRAVLAFCIALPLVFVLIFFGYFPLRYDVVLHTDNIAGEGMCETYVCPTVGYAAFYNVQFYFGSELKKATIQGYHYDVDPIELITSDVSEFDITGLDSYVHGLHLGHFEPEDILPEGETVEGSTAVLSSRNGALHVDVRDPDEGATVKFSLPFIPGWFRAVYFAALLLIAAGAALGVDWLLRRLPALRVPLLSAAGVAAALLAGCFFCGSLPYVTYINFLLNWLLLFAAALLLNALTLPFLGTVLTMALTTGWYIANYYVILFRNKPFFCSQDSVQLNMLCDSFLHTAEASRCFAERDPDRTPCSGMTFSQSAGDTSETILQALCGLRSGIGSAIP